MIFQKISKRFKVEYIFDFLVILTIVLSLFVFIKYFLKKEVWLNLTVKITAEKWYWGEESPPNWYALSVKKGDKEWDGSGKIIAEVTDITRYETGGNAKIIYLKTNVKTIYQKNSQTYLFKNKQLALNSPIELNLNNANIFGTIMQMNDYPKFDEVKNIVATVKIYDKYPWYTDSVNIGDKYTQGVETIAEVIDKKVTLSERTSLFLGKVPDGTRLPIVLDPLKRDLVLKMRIKVRKEGERDWIFRTDQLVKIGNELNIPLDNNINLFSANILAIEQ